jgi:hypothetical protein
LSKDRQKARCPSSHIILRQDLHDGSANGDADGVAEAERSRCDLQVFGEPRKKD